MRDIRAGAFDAFMAQGLPHRRIEEWKYTDLRALDRRTCRRRPAGAVGGRARRA